MKKIFKIFGWSLAGLTLFIIILLVIGKIEEKEIADIALQKISKSIKAPLKINNISLNLIRKFPYATIELENVSLGQADTVFSDSSNTGTTLASINKLFVSAKPIPLFNGELEIVKIEIRGVDCNYIINKEGISNFDFLLDTAASDTSSSEMKLILNELLLKDINCRYYDSLNLIGAQLSIPKARIKGKIDKNSIEGGIKGSVELSNCSYKTSTLVLMDKMALDFDLLYSDNLINVNELIITSDNANINIKGTVNLKEKMLADLSITAKDLILQDLIKYVPNQTIKDLGIISCSGNFGFESSIKGNLADSVLPSINANFSLKNGKIQTQTYPILDNIAFSGSYTNGKLRNNTTTSISLNKFHARTGSSTIDLKAVISNLDKIRYNLTTDAAVYVEDFRKLIPDTLVKDLKGQLQIKLASKGIIPKEFNSDYIEDLKENTSLDLTFNNLYCLLDSTKKVDSLSGRVILEKNHLQIIGLSAVVPQLVSKISNLSIDALLKGKISQPETIEIALNSFAFHTGKNLITCKGDIYNLKSPEIDIQSDIKIDLKEIKQYLPDSLVNSVEGNIAVHVKSKGKIDTDSISAQLTDFLFNNCSFKLDFDGVTAYLPDTLMEVKNLEGRIDLSSDTIHISNLSGLFKGIDFKIDSTKVLNIYKSVIKNEPSQLVVEGKINLGDLNYSMFLPFIASQGDSLKKSTELKSEESAKTNYKFLIKGKLGIRSFTYYNARVDNISALYNLTDSLYIVDQFKFTGFKGRHSTSVRFSIKGNEKTLSVNNSVDGMDINQLLRDFDNFKKFYTPQITYENISGTFSSKVDAQLFFINDSLISNKIYVRADSLKLEKGVIQNYQPLKDFEPYLKGAGKLDRLEFKTIKCNVFVVQSAIYVPSTKIFSNKLDAQALGMKPIGKDYTYHFMVFMSDIITGKPKKISKKQNKNGEEVDEFGREGTPIRLWSENGKEHVFWDFPDKRKETERYVKASEALLNFRFYPKLVNYNTGVK